MILKHLVLHNYRKFRALDIDFPEGLIAIVGRNGMGKSTLIEAVAFALYGTEASRTGATSIRREGAASSEPCSVTLEFTVRNEPYRVVRKLTGAHETQEVALYRGGNSQPLASRTKAVQQAIRQLLGMDYLTFTRSVLSRQKEVNILSESTPGERKKAIRRMLGIESIQSAIEAAREQRRGKEQWLHGVQESIKDLPDLRDQEEALKPRLREVRQHAEKMGQHVKSTVTESLAAQRELDAQEQLRAKDETLSKELAGAKVELRACEQTIQDVRRQVAASEKAGQEQRAVEPAEREFLKLSRRKEQLDKASGQHSEREELERECHERTLELEELDKTIQQARARVEKGQALSKKHRSVSAKKEKLARQSRECQKVLQTSRKVLAQAEIRAQDTRKHVQTLRAIGARDGTCPTCSQKLGAGYRELVKKLEAEARAAEAAYKKQSAHEKSARQATSAAEAAVTREQRSLDDLDARLRQHREQIQKLQSLEQQQVTLADQLKKKGERLARLATVDYDVREHRLVEKRLTGLKKQHELFARLGQEASHLANHQKRLKAELARQEKSRRHEERLQQERRTLGFEPNRYTAAKTRRHQANQRERAASEAHAAARGPLAACEEQARSLRQRIIALERDAERIRGEKAESLQLAQLVELLQAFQDELMARVGPQIEEYASRLLDQMTRGRYSRMILDDEYKISIDDGGQAHALDRFSGGEEDLANLCLRIAISQMVAQRAGGDTSSLLVLDEVFGSQDIERRERILEALNRVQGMFQQILLITHMEDIHERVPNMLRVTENGARDASIATF
ncbi:AAA family ATPase [Cystobacter fuscus]|uniref:AAA family ATPase n=1 Tax=Cystobacter fuscus TaxID=43 RepID=UPI0037C08CE2